MTNRIKFATYFGVATMWFVGGAIYPFLSNATKTVPPANIIVIRSVGAALILLIAVLVMAPNSFKQIKLSKSVVYIVIASLCFSPICSYTMAWASERVPGAITALMYATLPAMSSIYALAIGKPISRSAAIGVVLASIAVIFLIGAPEGDTKVSGIIAALISVLAWFIATEIWIANETNYPLILAIFLQVFVGAIGTVIFHFASNGPVITAAQIADPNMIFLIVALASQYWAYLGISRRVSPVVLTSFGFVNPIVAGVIGYLIFNQKVTLIQIISGAVVLFGVYIVVRGDKVSLEK